MLKDEKGLFLLYSHTVIGQAVVHVIETTTKLKVHDATYSENLPEYIKKGIVLEIDDLATLMGLVELVGVLHHTLTLRHWVDGLPGLKVCGDWEK